MQVSSDILVQSGSAEWAKKAHNAPKAGKAATEKTADAQVSISADAGKSNSAEALVKARANALPEVREEKIAVAKERLESDYYNTEEFNKELANHLAEG
jgi:hypothetical protein